MLDNFSPHPTQVCQQDDFLQPQLLVVIDTEEEFDWSKNFSRANTSVQSIRGVSAIQKIFDQYHIRPVYVIDYPVASQPDGYLPLLEIFQDHRCAIGSHLHPWVNPPFEEEVSRHHSFPGNLPMSLEQEKLRTLGNCIEDHFNFSPTIYKAGRYGFGPNTTGILEALGYECDLSVCPKMDWSSEGGPNFLEASPWPYWFGLNGKLLEFPVTTGYTGVFRNSGNQLHQLVTSQALQPFHLMGICSRLHLLDKIWLSPEGFTFPELRRLTKVLLRQGLNIFSFAFHSSSLKPGHTPYVRTSAELETFLDKCRKFFDFFFGELKGQSRTPLELKEAILQRD